MSTNDVNKVTAELKKLYYNSVLPIEKEYLYHKFYSSEILESEMNSKPTILLVGQYSTGKTTFIRNLLGMDYPEMHIGPEPTTDRFIAVVHGNESKVIKGNALTGVTDLPFYGLSSFGSGFLNKFCAAIVPAPLLKQVNIIDTPGVLSGEKQRTSRGYDFAKVSEWFANRSDLILLMFDPSKLDISDEFKSVIEELRPYEDKIHCVLNKADTLDPESLMRVYGALLWSMGKIFRGAEVTRVYVGCFKENLIIRDKHIGLFKRDRDALLTKLDDLPKACGMRKVNDMVRRIRLVNINVCILGYLKSKMPYFWGKMYTQEKLIEQLPEIFLQVQQMYNLSEGDFPHMSDYRNVLRLLDFTTFPSTKREVLLALRTMLQDDIPSIMSHIHRITNDDDDDSGSGNNNDSVCSDTDGFKKRKNNNSNNNSNSSNSSSNNDNSNSDSSNNSNTKQLLTQPLTPLSSLSILNYSENHSLFFYILSFHILIFILIISIIIVYLYLAPEERIKVLGEDMIQMIDGLMKLLQ